MNTNQHLYSVALALSLPRDNAHLNRLVGTLGSAEEVWKNRHFIGEIHPDMPPRVRNLAAAVESQIERAERELQFCAEHEVDVIVQGDEAYPHRLLQCPDAPIVLFRRGDFNLNAARLISVVGTRHATPHGKDFVEQLCRDLGEALPRTVVVSGLAYGIDICAHRAALDCGLPTVAVVAHGMDQIYPTIHRATAERMTGWGGALISQYPSQTRLEKMNFVARNRIVAGMSDVTLVVESGIKGGSLITARLATAYGRPVVAMPGRPSDEMSAGCNAMIRSGEAQLINSAEDLMALLQWEPSEALKPRQRELFTELSAEERKVAEALKGTDGLDANTLSVRTGIGIAALANLLFDMEMAGTVRLLPGSRYALAQP